MFLSILLYRYFCIDFFTRADFAGNPAKVVKVVKVLQDFLQKLQAIVVKVAKVVKDSLQKESAPRKSQG